MLRPTYTPVSRSVTARSTHIPPACRGRVTSLESGPIMEHRHCPTCGTSKTILAPRETVSDDLLGALTIYPFRCQLCAERFRAFLGRRAMNPRRSFERVDVAFPVWFRGRFEGPMQLGQEGTIENLSIRGCRIRCRRPLSRGMRVELEFQHSNCSFPITVDEAVVRSTVGGMVGLRFLQLQREDAQRIRQIVDLWLPESLPRTR
jgi:hypothetical protein